MLDAALRQRKARHDAGVALGHVAVSVSRRQLRDPRFAGAVFDALSRHGLRPVDLEIEITGSLFVGDVDGVRARHARCTGVAC